MKFRTDFVTNSSSSSFMYLSIKGNKIMEILNKYKEIFGDSEISISKDLFTYNGEELEYTLPDEPGVDMGLVEWFIEYLIKDIIDDHAPEKLKEEFVKDLEQNKEMIENSTDVVWDMKDCSWGEGAWDEDDIYEYMNLPEDTEITDELYEEFEDLMYSSIHTYSYKVTYKEGKYNFEGGVRGIEEDDD